MKKQGFFFLLMLCLVFTLGLSAKTTSANSKKNVKKTYITSGNIQIVDDGLFLCTEAGLVPISKVGKDKNGTYVSLTDSAWEVKCPKCGQIYDLDNCSKKCPHPINLYRPKSG